MSTPDRPIDNPNQPPKRGAAVPRLGSEAPLDLAPDDELEPGNPAADEMAVLDSDDSGELELEELDPEARSPALEVAEQQIADAAASLDVDEFYRDYNRGAELDGLLQDFQFRFQVRHLMLLTAGLAVALSLWKIASAAGVLLLVLAGLGGAHVYLAYRERKRQEEVQARRDRLVELARAQKAGQPAEASHEFEQATAEVRDAGDQAGFQVSFSLKQVMIAMTVACVVLGVLSALPLAGVLSVKVVAAILGGVALSGLGVHALGFDPPPVVALGWWLILAMYILLSVYQQLTAGA